MQLHKHLFNRLAHIRKEEDHILAAQDTIGSDLKIPKMRPPYNNPANNASPNNLKEKGRAKNGVTIK